VGARSGGEVAVHEQDEAGVHERLELAAWRRDIAALYATVRAEAAHDPQAAWERWRATREELFRTSSQSPVPAVERAGFRAHHWPYDPAWRFEVAVEPWGPEARAAGVRADGHPETTLGGLSLALPVSTGGQEELSRIGRVTIPFEAGARSLGLYWMTGYSGGLFLPFRDATSGRETYGAGRYLLDAAKSADLGPGSERGSLILDFNFSFQPSCAFDPRWACPLAPPENRLDIPVEAGERLV
jgi:uncharacterized protein (DUF1684 family)